MESASFWSVDLHVHTPGSADAKAEAYGTPEAIVRAAIAADLDAIAITDHNSAEWCDRVAQAAKESSLIVLPGVEISTTEGHLLAIWEEGTPSAVINDLLARLKIGHAERGKLDIAASVGFAAAAEEVAELKGLAIAAHIDRPKGLLKMEVKAHLVSTLLNEALCAVEVVHSDAIAEVDLKVKGHRELAYVQGSDTWDQATSAHGLSGIGKRRTWIKAGRADLAGIRHALADPELRVRLEEPPAVEYPYIETVEIFGGFLAGLKVGFSRDLNCLLGGTGTGKSLILEAIRFAMNQQLDRRSFSKLWDEVQSRLAAALTESGSVRLVVATPTGRFRIERAFSRDGSALSNCSAAIRRRLCRRQCGSPKSRTHSRVLPRRDS